MRARFTRAGLGKERDRIVGKFGEGFNLAIWRPVTKSAK